MGTTGQNVTAAISGLTPATTYHFRVIAENAGGTTEGSDMTFTTSMATTATSLSSIQKSWGCGESWTLTVTVTSSPGTPQGTVTFKDGALILGTSTLSGGTATFTVPSLTVGKHTITAEYNGNPTYAASVSDEIMVSARQFLIFPFIRK